MVPAGHSPEPQICPPPLHHSPVLFVFRAHWHLPDRADSTPASQPRPPVQSLWPPESRWPGPHAKPTTANSRAIRTAFMLKCPSFQEPRGLNRGKNYAAAPRIEAEGKHTPPPTLLLRCPAEEGDMADLPTRWTGMGGRGHLRLPMAQPTAFAPPLSLVCQLQDLGSPRTCVLEKGMKLV